MPERYLQKTLPNGLTLLGERMTGVKSAAMTFLLPAGCETDPPKATGAASVLADLVLRGAGQRDNRQLTDWMDSLGLQRSSSVGIHHSRLGCAALASRVMQGMSAYADIVRRPHLPEAGFHAARDLALQSLAGIEDEPRHKVLIKLRECHFPYPFGRNAMGEKDDLERLTRQTVQEDFRRRYHPRGAILSLAGDIDYDDVTKMAEDLFGDWVGFSTLAPQPAAPTERVHHLHHDSEQTHIGLAYPGIVETDPNYYAMRLAMEVLGGGMSGRLFTEIREKRALVYNVWAGYVGLRGYGSIMGYAGTSNDRAQATLVTFIAEVRRLCDGIMPGELERAKTGLKAATIMQGESTSARASAIAHDYFMRGRLRTLDEIKAEIDGVSLDQVNAWLADHQPGPFTIVTVGPKPLDIKDEL